MSADNNKTLFIAEVSSNHACDLDRCRRFIDVAASIGCDAVKFQLFRIHELFSSEVLERSETHRQREKWELPESFIPELAKYCRDKGVEFCCTPFSLAAVEILEPHVSFFKIASYEIVWPALVKACAATGKPLVMSTGMANMDEVHDAVGWAREAGASDITLLHCVSNYPTAPQEANLAAIETLRKNNDCAVGWSDHSVNPSVIARAIHRWGASVIEFHLDLEGDGAEFESGHCWLPDQIGRVIEDINIAHSADGNGEKIPTESEIPERLWRADPVDGLRPFKQIRDEIFK